MSKIKVLIVDDSKFTRDLIKRELLNYGCEIAGEAENGEEAINLYEKTRPDLVTMDIEMPVMNGIDSIEEIIKINPNALIIVISNEPKNKEDALKKGATSFLSKPFQPAFLWRQIDSISEGGLFDKVNKGTNSVEKTSDEIFIIEPNHDEDIKDIQSTRTNKELSTSESLANIKKSIKNNKTIESKISKNEKKKTIEEEALADEESESIFTIKKLINENKSMKDADIIKEPIAENKTPAIKKQPEINEDKGIEDFSKGKKIKISISPPRGEVYKNIEESKTRFKSYDKNIEAPILNYIETEEEVEEEDKKEEIFKKIRNLFNKIKK